jgi:hypothetical protein
MWFFKAFAGDIGIAFSLFVSPSSCQLWGLGVGVEPVGVLLALVFEMFVGESVDCRGVGREDVGSLVIEEVEGFPLVEPGE